MTPFGKPDATPAPAAGGGGGERWELRTLSFVEDQEKTTGAGKVYWRVKDSNGKWYSVWEASIKATIDATYPGTLPCAIQIKPGRDGGNPFYTIAGVGASAEAMVKEGSVKAAASEAPGGRNSAFGKRMHPDDALRVTNLACQERAIQMVALTIMDKPETVTYETYVKAKVVEYTNFLSSLINQPLTPTPQTPAPIPGDPGPDPTMPAAEDTESDADIPF